MNSAQVKSLSDTEVEELADMGASAAFVTVVTTPLQNICGVDRSLAHEKVHSYFSRNTEENISIGGSFLSALWDGDLFKAYRKADNVNRAILHQIFNSKQIIAAGVANSDEPISRIKDFVEQ